MYALSTAILCVMTVINVLQSHLLKILINVKNIFFVFFSNILVSIIWKEQFLFFVFIFLV